MDPAAFARYLEPPPRLVPNAEALPHLGGLALAPFKGELPEEMELHPVEAMRDEFTEAAAQELMKRALGMQEVKARLGRGRIVPIGVSRRGETAKEERRSYLAVAYDYTANVAVEITLDEQGAFVGMSDEQYQPPPIQSEIDRAIELARSDQRLSAKVSNLVGMAIPFAGPANEYARRRVLEVLFGCRTERLPRFRAWVDLATETVLHAGEGCACCDRQVQS
jgi:hypothetical protein